MIKYKGKSNYKHSSKGRKWKGSGVGGKSEPDAKETIRSWGSDSHRNSSKSSSGWFG